MMLKQVVSNSDSFSSPQPKLEEEVPLFSYNMFIDDDGDYISKWHKFLGSLTRVKV
jgi:hypothetical protein